MISIDRNSKSLPAPYVLALVSRDFDSVANSQVSEFIGNVPLFA